MKTLLAVAPAVVPILAGILVASVTHAQPTDDRILAARSVRCDFGAGTQGSWASGRLKLEQSTFGVGVDSMMTFDSINIKAGTARIIGNQGAGNVSVFVTPVGLSFVEQTGSGSLNFTTVFRDYDASRRFIGVTSRHMSLFRGPLPSQFHGTCSIFE